MTAGGRSPNAARPGRPADARPPAARRPARPGRRAGPSAERQWRMAGLPVSSASAEVPPQVRQLVRDRAEDAVVVEPGLADRHDPRVRGPADDPRASPRRRPWRRRAGGPRPPRRARRTARRSASARSDEATFQPGTRIRSTPASRAAPTTWSASASNRSALRWQWLSMRRIGTSRGARRTDRRGSRSRRPRFDVEPREERLGRRQPAGLAGMGAPRELVEDRRAAVAVGRVRVGVAELGEEPRRGRRAGTARRPGRPAGRPRRGRRGRRAAALRLPRRPPSRPWPGPTAARRRRPCWRRRCTPTARPGRRAGGMPSRRLAIDPQRLAPAVAERRSRRRARRRALARRDSGLVIDTVRLTRLPKSLARSAL